MNLSTFCSGSALCSCAHRLLTCGFTSCWVRIMQITFPKDLVHHGNVEHRDVHNLYGKLYHQVCSQSMFMSRSAASAVSSDELLLKQSMQMGLVSLCHFWQLQHKNTATGMPYQASARGLAERGSLEHGEKGDRPFVLSRAFFAGTQTVRCGIHTSRQLRLTPAAMQLLKS